jgi:hypothetical protein
MSSVEKLLERMRRSKRGWRFRDLDRLYRGFGFEAVQGAKHTMYIHPKFQHLRATVTRARSMPIGYVVHAVELVMALKTMEESEDG